MLSEPLLKQIRLIQIRSRRVANLILQGNQKSAFKGHGMEFDQVREYEPGDDVRSIDWNVTARMQHPYIKQHIEEREMMVMLLVDISASGWFGSEEKRKREIAAEVAAVIAYLAINQKNKIGMILFSDQIECFIPPRKGRGHIWKVIQDILIFESTHSKTDLTVALAFLNRIITRRSIAFVISDFLAPSFETALTLATRRHDLIALPIVDPREKNLPDVGFLTVQDPETGEISTLNTHSKALRDRYRQQREGYERHLKSIFQKLAIDTAWIQTNEPYIPELIKLFQLRGAKH